MNILFFTKGDKVVPSSRQRVWRVAERLHTQYGWEYKVMHSIGYSLFSISFSRFKTLFYVTYNLQLTTYNCLFVHKSLFPWDVVLLIIASKKLFRKKLVYDLDDAEWIHSPKKSRMLARHADIIFCGSHEILRWAEQYNNTCVFIPTALDVSLYADYAVSHDKRDVLTIGWIGQGKAHFKAGNFTVLKTALTALCADGMPFRFVIIGSQNYQPLHDYFSSVSFEVIFVDEADWTRESAVPKLVNEYFFDMGVMPLADTPFNRAKCAFKAVEYMACGVPTVASPVGEAPYVIKNKINGFLAQTPEEWALAIETLLKDVSLRKRMGKAGKEFIGVQYSYQSIIPLIKEELVKLDNKTNNGIVEG